MSIYLIILLSLLKTTYIIKIHRLNFERHLTGLTVDNVMKKLFNNDIYTKIKFGSEEEKIPFSFQLDIILFI